jgi:hypothetical protein
VAQKKDITLKEHLAGIAEKGGLARAAQMTPEERSAGGKARATKLSKEQRVQIARKAAQKRWSAQVPKQ